MSAEIREKLERGGFEQILEYKDGTTEVNIFVCGSCILKIQSWL